MEPMGRHTKVYAIRQLHFKRVASLDMLFLLLVLDGYHAEKGTLLAFLCLCFSALLTLRVLLLLLLLMSSLLLLL